MGLLSLLGAALYYHPLMTIALAGVIVALIGTGLRRRRTSAARKDFGRKISDRSQRER